MDKDILRKFITKSGLKQKSICELVGLPTWLISKYLSGCAIMTKNQTNKLQEFIDEFTASNNFMRD